MHATGTEKFVCEILKHKVQYNGAYRREHGASRVSQSIGVEGREDSEKSNMCTTPVGLGFSFFLRRDSVKENLFE